MIKRHVAPYLIYATLAVTAVIAGVQMPMSWSAILGTLLGLRFAEFLVIYIYENLVAAFTTDSELTTPEQKRE